MPAPRRQVVQVRVDLLCPGVVAGTLTVRGNWSGAAAVEVGDEGGGVLASRPIESSRLYGAPLEMPSTHHGTPGTAG